MTDYSSLVYSVAKSDAEDPIATFCNKQDAQEFIDRIANDWGYRVIDTTPKPKIPADAEFIHWQNLWKNTAAREGLNQKKPWAYDGVLVSEEELLEQIGDAEVVVLKRA